jgi:hypothetical protein
LARRDLTLVGRGSQEANLRALAADLGLRHVIFIGPLAQAGLAAAYADHDIFVQSANVDNGPTSMLRAFASGLPVVSTTAGAVPAMLTHGVHGLLAPLADYETLGHHVLRLLASPDWARGLARAAHATCEAWSWPRVREQWLRTYASVLVPPARTTRSVLTRFIPGSVPFAGTGLPTQISFDQWSRGATTRLMIRRLLAKLAHGRCRDRLARHHRRGARAGRPRRRPVRSPALVAHRPAAGARAARRTGDGACRAAASAVG